MNKRGYEFSFAWLFAILVGAAVIFFAIFATTQIIETQRFRAEAERGKEIGVLLNPVETNLEQAKVVEISVSEETRIFNGCEIEGNFGRQTISTSIRSGFGSEWRPERGIASTFNNRHIFSNGTVQGEKEFYILSKPFKYPFKVADLIMMWSEKESYCFVGAATSFPEIDQEINDLHPKNLVSVSSISNCEEKSKKVCFPSARGPECDIEIFHETASDSGSVLHKRTGERNFYVHSFDDNDKYVLLYAAIFSQPEVYDCQIGRLMKRASNLAELYKDKSQFLQAENCGGAAPIQMDLVAYSNEIRNILASGDSFSFYLKNSNLPLIIENPAGGLKDKNDRLICKLF